MISDGEWVVGQLWAVLLLGQTNDKWTIKEQSSTIGHWYTF